MNEVEDWIKLIEGDEMNKELIEAMAEDIAIMAGSKVTDAHRAVAESFIDLCQPQWISELNIAYMDLLNAVIEYRDYEHSGDPWEEDARAMGEMMIDDMKRDGRIDKYIELSKKLPEPPEES